MTLTYKILILFAALFGLLRLFITTDKLARAILTGQILAISLILIGNTLTGNTIVATIGLLLFMLTLVLAIIYGLKKDFKYSKRTLIIIPAALVFIEHYLEFQDHPTLLKPFMFIPIITFIMVIVNIKSYRNELGFLTIITVDATIKFIRVLEQIIN